MTSRRKEEKMGRGSSKAGGGGGKGKTPSGYTIDDFNKMSADEKIDTLNNIIADRNIKVPAYLDDSDTSKVLYALGMDKKPTVVSDDALDKMQGREIFRTVYEDASCMPPPSSTDITDQIRNGDYTQLSGKGGSAHGRALYFATDFKDSALYGSGEKNPVIMRAKINSNARMADEHQLYVHMRNDNKFDNNIFTSSHADKTALYALYSGYDGWYSNYGYEMIINRGVITTSSKNKQIYGKNRFGSTSVAQTWKSAFDLD